MHRKFSVALALFVVSLVAAAPALAAPVTIGSVTGSHGAPAVQCISALQLATAPSSPSYVVPFDGTITSWSVQGTAQAAPVQLQVYRPVGPNQWRLVAETPVRTAAANVVSTFSAKIAVKAGDILGRTGLGCVYTSGVPADQVLTFGTHPAIGSVVTPDGPGASAWRLNVRAKVEPDCSKGNRKKPKACKAR
jgi:hypothetical protein